MPWQKVTPSMVPPSGRQAGVPRCNLLKNGTVRFNRAAVDCLDLEGQTKVLLYFDAAKVAIEPVTGSAKEAEGWPVTWPKSDSGACRINIGPLLRYFRLTPPVGRYPFSVDAKATGYIVIDLANGGGK